MWKNGGGDTREDSLRFIFELCDKHALPFIGERHKPVPASDFQSEP